MTLLAEALAAFVFLGSQRSLRLSRVLCQSALVKAWTKASIERHRAVSTAALDHLGNDR